MNQDWDVVCGTLPVLPAIKLPSKVHFNPQITQKLIQGKIEQKTKKKIHWDGLIHWELASMDSGFILVHFRSTIFLKISDDKHKM